MNKEQAKSKIRMSVTVNKDNIKSLEKADDIIDQIYNDHEEQLKAKDELMAKKDEEIERLRVENRKFMEYITLKQLSEPIIFCASCSGKVIKLKEQQ